MDAKLGGLSTLYFFRHGQAGLRDDYDNLSELGHQQARALGEFLAGQELNFSRCLVGGLVRQQKTMAEVQDAYAAASINFPAPVIDPGWNEFDLDGVCAGLAPLIAADDPVFAEEWEAMTLATQDAASHLHRAWLPCDAEIVRAWVEDRYEFAGESWPDFQNRIRISFEKLLNGNSDTDQNVAVFTSGTPIALLSPQRCNSTHAAHCALPERHIIQPLPVSQ